MISSDVTACTAISLGAAVSVSATMLFLDARPDSRVVVEAVPVVVEVVPLKRPGRIVDYAIIRSPAETMVGPEGPSTGWLPPRGPALERPR